MNIETLLEIPELVELYPVVKTDVEEIPEPGEEELVEFVVGSGCVPVSEVEVLD